MGANPDQTGDNFDRASESNATITAVTPPSTIYGDEDKPDLVESRALRVGHTYVIRSVSCGRILTLLNAEVTLEQHNSLGAIYWKCVETDGWLGFQNTASGRFLRHGGGRLGLHCSSSKHNLWERMQIRPHADYDQGYMLLMEFHRGLRPVGSVKENGKEILGRIVDKSINSLAWVFLEVS